IKPATTSILRCFGFRNVLLGNGLLNAAAIACCALITRDTPLALSCLILFIGGMTRSMQFTALNTVAFGDVPQTAMTAANTLFSASFQLSMGLGIALGAISWRLGSWVIASDATPATPFHIAFLIIALVSSASLIDCLKLPPDAGAHLAQRSKNQT